MTPNYKSIHEEFRLNGHSFSRQKLKDFAYSFTKEGEEFEQAIGHFLADWLDENDTIKVTTSGSTGAPKEISVKKGYMVNSALATGDFFNLDPGNNALLCLSGNYIAGKMMLVRAMVLGLHLDYFEPTSNPLSRNSKHYDFCAMVPLQLQNSTGHLDRIKTLIVGGAPISPLLRDKVQNTSCTIFETYGMTETITHIAVKQLNRLTVDVTSSPSAKLRAGSLEMPFKALPNVDFSMDNRACLIIHAPKVSNEPVITNDMVKLISNNEFEWLGRYDNVINSGGVKLFPEQIEKKLTDLVPNRFFVAELPDEALGRKLVLIVEGEIDSEDLLRRIGKSSSLEKYEVPKEIHLLRSFLETKTGKIRRKENVVLIQS